MHGTPPDFRRPPADNAMSVRKRPGYRLPPEPLTQDEVARLFGVCDPRSTTGARDRALLALLYRAGLRIAEALALEVKDLELERGAVRVLRGKGGLSRVVGIDPWGAGRIEVWLERRAGLGLAPRGPVLCTLHGTPLTASYARVLLPRIGARAGLDKRVHPHGLRHTFAAELRAEGVDIGVISKQLGHRSVASTGRYLDHIAPSGVVSAIRSRAVTRAG